MHVDQLLEVLKRSDVKEIALQSDRPPCVLIGDKYAPIVKQMINEEQIMLLLGHANGRTEILGLMDGPRRWDYQHPAIGTIGVSAAYHGNILQVRFRLKTPAARPAAPAGPKATFGKPRATPARAAAPSEGGLNPVGSPLDFDGFMEDRPAPSHGLDFDVAAEPRDAFEVDNGPLASFANPQAGRRPTAADEELVIGGPRQARRVTRGDALDFGAPQVRRTTSADAGLGFGGADSPLEPPPLEFDDAAPMAPGASPLEAMVEEAVTDAPPWPPGEHMRTLENLLRQARQTRATDLHIVAGRPPMMRIAGEMMAVGESLSPEIVEQMMQPIVPDRLREDLATHGSCDYALVHPRLGRFRANVSRMRTGMKLSARPIGHKVPTLTDLGLPESISSATHHHQGLIIVTGPTGHGKTTTLAAIVDIINRERTHHIITVEDPIEYVHVSNKAMVSQRQVGAHTRTFAAALKGSLREDPDVIVVGELRDTDTVRMALSASETGHLVISTMNTPSAAKAIERLIDLFPPGDQPQVRLTLAGGLRLVISQRLVPTFDRKALCCAAELLPGSPPLWALIRDNKTFQIPSLQQRGKALGIIRLDDSLAALVKDGKTTAGFAKLYAENPEQFEALVSGRPLRPEEAPINLESLDPTGQAAQRGIQMGKDMFSKAGRLFGGDKK